MWRQSAGFLGLVVLMLSAAAQTAPPAGMPKAWRLVHPDAVVLVGVDVRSIRQSAAGKSLDKSLSQVSLGLMSLPAMQFLRDIDQVLISAPDEKKTAPVNQAVKTPGNMAKSAALIILTGHFPAGHLQSLLRGPSHAYNGVEVYASSPGGVNSGIALLNENTLLMGDANSIHGAIDRSQRSNRSPSPLLVRAASLAAGNDLWVLATALPSMRPPAGFQPAGLNLQSIVSELRGVEAGIAFRDGMKLAINLSTNDARMASKWVDLLTAKLRSAMEGKLDAQQSAELFHKLDISAEGNQIRVKFALSPAELERAVLLARQMNAAQPEFTLRAPSPRPAPGVIKVYGMPGGVREIPIEADPQE